MALYKPPTRVALPEAANVDFADPESVKRYMTQLNTALLAAFDRLVFTTEATAEILMLSPHGSAYALTVNDAGALVVVPRNVKP
jgi:hypothetical protein